nr:uroporphyrinogen-III C-methyltransferase [Actinomycetota bacterium]
MTVYLVGAGPGDPGLLTVRGAELLRSADVVLHDRLVAPDVLTLVRGDALRIDVGKRPGTGTPGADRRQHDIGRLLVEHGRTSAVVVRLKGGDPFVFGRGSEEVEILEEAGIPWQVVPGVTSALGVLGAVGIPATHRGLASSVTVVAGRTRDPGDAPRTGHEPNWEALAHTGGTLVVLMGMGSRAAISAALLGAGRAADTPVAVVQDGTTPAQRVVRTTLSGLPDVDLGAPAVIV